MVPSTDQHGKLQHSPGRDIAAPVRRSQVLVIPPLRGESLSLLPASHVIWLSCQVDPSADPAGSASQETLPPNGMALSNPTPNTTTLYLNVSSADLPTKRQPSVHRPLLIQGLAEPSPVLFGEAPVWMDSHSASAS
ncbi:hypothetical protein AALO_G00104360 [Alosa alosa]|uniref:Uncharacterized protein n=1 Tax=Alosa alosa TaxID=278164 RepID=A0AAV6H0X7_9TELE|nr:hypothetical protein AALO_G00104360 [Alosa alosa]